MTTLLKIQQVGHPVLRNPARPLSREELRSAEIQELIRMMRETMREAPGVGLAAPQVGVGIRLVVIEDRPEGLAELDSAVLAERERTPVAFHVLVNPEIEYSGDAVEFCEGCLSLAGFTALVPRARAVRVRCLDEWGQDRTIEARGWYARILQHEIDHLNGHLYIDRMLPQTFMQLSVYEKLWKRAPASEVKAAYGVADRPWPAR